MNFETCVIIGSLLFNHWVSDFVLQSDWMAKNKSKSWNALLQHTGTYTFSMMLWYCGYSLAAGMFNVVDCFLFGGITFICHTITDAITSRITSKLYQKGDIHNFFVVVGFDQWLHLVQLIVTACFVFGLN